MLNRQAAAAMLSAILCTATFTAPAAHAADAGALPCKALEGIPAAVADAPFLVLGEVHGTREVPAFVGAYLCAAAKQQRKITLAVEFEPATQAAFDAFMASQGAPQDVKRLLASGRWQSPRQDGKTSIDMLRLFQLARMLRASGADLRVAAVDDDSVMARRSSAIAERLRSELRQGAGRQVVALIGGLHAVRTRGNRFNPDHESAIYLLADRRPLSLTVGTAGGSAWVCRGATPATCGATAWDINRVDPAPGGPFSLAPPLPQFDGVFFVGATTASPPAVSGLSADATGPM